MNKPNFFILGAPKCGTTSLAYWLSQHPNVFMSPNKEPHYFSNDLNHNIEPWRDYEHYLSLYKSADSNHKIIGEASTWYLRSVTAVKNIEAKLDNVRYIVMLRNPVEMAPSLHGQLLFVGRENVVDFETAWHLQERRLRGEAIPGNCPDPEFLQYRKACSLGEQLERLYKTVSRDRVLVIFLEDIENDVHREWRRILKFLDLPMWTDLDFKAENRAKYWQWRWIRNLMILYVRVLRLLGLPWLRTGLLKYLVGVSIKSGRKPLTLQLCRELEVEFVQDVNKLAKLTQRDLSHWIKG
ncbi:hypothetical protein J2T55_002408 [Methylohalomonas lacus]|uniref:Sulfotransferase domain-containing protein n=1 Tax=Methylohalomonas lacus TaxID=398773 RepID=A0AAE3HNC2_9GAMM|nr:sulfotransferase domain-containing protein [Methylohalomonas lacus]MCS3904372.1 hypothetical protein [Methylohalomonas lacus]